MDENDIVAGIGYFIGKTYNEESKIEDVIENLDEFLLKFDQLLCGRFVRILCLGTRLQYLFNQV